MVLDDVRRAVDQLAQSHRGQNAIRRLLGWLGDDGLALDSDNQRAVVTILQACWGKWPGTTQECMGEAIAAVIAARAEARAAS